MTHFGSRAKYQERYLELTPPCSKSSYSLPGFSVWCVVFSFIAFRARQVHGALGSKNSGPLGMALSTRPSTAELATLTWLNKFVNCVGAPSPGEILRVPRRHLPLLTFSGKCWSNCRRLWLVVLSVSAEAPDGDCWQKDGVQPAQLFLATGGAGKAMSVSCWWDECLRRCCPRNSSWVCLGMLGWGRRGGTTKLRFKKSVHPWKFGVVFVTTRQGQDHGSGNSTNEGKVHNGMVARIRPMVPWPWSQQAFWHWGGWSSTLAG